MSYPGLLSTLEKKEETEADKDKSEKDKRTGAFRTGFRKRQKEGTPGLTSACGGPAKQSRSSGTLGNRDASSRSAAGRQSLFVRRQKTRKEEEEEEEEKKDKGKQKQLFE